MSNTLSTKRAFFERLSARRYYGKHARGSVILVNGSPLYHASAPEVNSFWKNLVLRRRP